MPKITKPMQMNLQINRTKNRTNYYYSFSFCFNEYCLTLTAFVLLSFDNGALDFVTN